MGIVAAALGDTLQAISTFASVWLILILLEWRFPKERVSWHGRLKALAFWAVSIPIWAVISAAFRVGWHQLAIEPLFNFDIGDAATWPILVVSIFLGNLIGDFFFYWRHRAQHAFFWRFHSVHHSIRELSAVGSYHHLSEEIFRLLLAVVPMAFIVDIDGALIGGFIGYLHGFYIHSSTRLHMPTSLRFLLGDNAYHRIHHSTLPEHFGRNFAIFPIWDVVFGTAYFPKEGEWPDAGLADRPEPEDTLEWLAAPWAQPGQREPSEQAVLPTQQ